MSKEGKGHNCEWCKRKLEAKTSRSSLAATRDHVVPKSKGGRTTVWACRHCNELKRDMSLHDWQDFMTCFPEWWSNPNFKNFGKHRSAKVDYRRWQDRSRIERAAEVTKMGPLPYSESMMIIRHGKDYWKAWKQRGGPVCECCQRASG